MPPHVLVRPIDAECVLLNINNERYFGLNEVGTRMWTTLTSAQSIQAAYEALLHEYRVDAEQLRQDLQSLVGELVENGLIEVGGG